MSLPVLVYSSDPSVRWIYTRLDRTTNSADHVLAAEIWERALSEMDLPANSKRAHGRTRREFIGLVRNFHGLGAQRVKRVGPRVVGYYECLRWIDIEPVNQEDKIEVIIDRRECITR